MSRGFPPGSGAAGCATLTIVLDGAAASPPFVTATVGARPAPSSAAFSFTSVRARPTPLAFALPALLLGLGGCGPNSAPPHDEPESRAHLFLQTVDADATPTGWSAVHIDSATGDLGSARAVPELAPDLPHWSLDSGRLIVGSEPLDLGRHRFHLYRMGADSSPEPWGTLDLEFPPRLQWMSLTPTLAVGPVSRDLYVSNLDGQLRVFDGDSLDLIRTYAAPSRTVRLEIDPDEEWMLRGTDTDTYTPWTLYSIATGEPNPALFDEVLTDLTGPEWIAPGTLRYATDTAVVVRRAPDFAPTITPLPPGPGAIAAVRFSSTKRLSWTRRDGAVFCEVWIGRFTSDGIVADTKVAAPTCSPGRWSPRGDVLLFDGPSGLAWADPEDGTLTPLRAEPRNDSVVHWLWPNVLRVRSCDGSLVGENDHCRTELWAPFELQDGDLRADVTAFLPRFSASFVHEP